MPQHPFGTEALGAGGEGERRRRRRKIKTRAHLHEQQWMTGGILRTAISFFIYLLIFILGETCATVSGGGEEEKKKNLK